VSHQTINFWFFFPLEKYLAILENIVWGLTPEIVLLALVELTLLKEKCGPWRRGSCRSGRNCGRLAKVGLFMRRDVSALGSIGPMI
jgi:hypothetical protein